MASCLGIHRSNIYREIKRNEGELGYRYEQAHRKAQDRRYKANHQRLKMKGRTLFNIQEKLKKQWSPEQISGWLKNRKNVKNISHETIYKYIWLEKRMGGSLQMLHFDLERAPFKKKS